MRRSTGEAAPVPGVRLPLQRLIETLPPQAQRPAALRRVRTQTSTAAETLLEHAKLPLSTWFQAIFLITQGKKGILAIDFMRKIVRATMERAGEKPLAGLVQAGRSLPGRCPGRQDRARSGGQDALRRGAGDARGAATERDQAPDGGQLPAECDREPVPPERIAGKQAQQRRPVVLRRGRAGRLAA
ncbi:MAG: hypothetical protein OXI01_02080 [Albidovulum sp.]|nr:hypothetical protein [Albidovulum sp.]